MSKKLYMGMEMERNDELSDSMAAKGIKEAFGEGTLLGAMNVTSHVNQMASVVKEHGIVNTFIGGPMAGQMTKHEKFAHDFVLEVKGKYDGVIYKYYREANALGMDDFVYEDLLSDEVKLRLIEGYERELKKRQEVADVLGDSPNG